MDTNGRIFLVEDDKNFGMVLKSYLEINGYYVELVEDGGRAIQRFHEDVFDICILDVMLPKKDGFTIAKEIRMINDDIPLFFLTAKTLKEDIIKGFNLGADDYITKPFDSDVLIEKIKAILKRNRNKKNASSVNEYKIGKYIFNYKLRTIILEDKKQKISPREGELLKLLCLSENNLLSRKKALLTIWGDDNYFTTRSMDVFITKLRKYFKDDPLIEIVNIHGSGYRLMVGDD
ncbi:MAG: response regulator transcription factor [Bacteroidales bacterium]|nr:response regulator transcription factor [Bacteroidales bacterium]